MVSLIGNVLVALCGIHFLQQHVALLVVKFGNTRNALKLLVAVMRVAHTRTGMRALTKLSDSSKRR